MFFYWTISNLHVVNIYQTFFGVVKKHRGKKIRERGVPCEVIDFVYVKAF